MSRARFDDATLPRRLLVSTMEHDGHLMVSIWVNDLESIVAVNDLDGISREELHRRVGEIVVKQGLGIWQGFKE